ncbi:sensor histidine kinase [Micromonospora sagamiensis]|uniref:Signal transduction histidine kinase n=1 Tax=Micromonospora sagamiensis TaxID=47875 RepID=A0A562WBD1_9ACTN|nr:ATP-binding protein [Micromonospora sagamiensis]TWJ27580.1 signal transduction histidine kinase [Micromonospora sagamiensis]BCL13535.1 histidine kinase [Micromonospora sagamiensis]
MPAVAAPSSPVVVPDDPATAPPVAASPAGDALNRVFTTLPVMLRLTCGLAGAVTALAVRTPPVRPVPLVVAVVVLTGWSLWFTRSGIRSGLTPGLIGADVALTVVTCLLLPYLVATEVLPGEVSWVAILASTTVIVAQLASRPRWAVPAGLLVAGAYALGAHRAGNDAEAVAHATTLVVQTASATALAVVLRRSSRRADAAFTERQRVLREAVIARTAREAERRQNRDLHDTVLSTLTMVGLGAVRSGSPLLRERAAADLRTLAAAGTPAEREVVPPSTPSDATRTALDGWLRGVAARVPELPVAVDLAPGVTVPVPVAAAFAESTAAALANVLRHAPGAAVRLRLAGVAGTVVVEVVDDGPGFDPALVPTHRYGLRESIRGRMTAVGGRATVDAAPGRGTRIRLEWPDAG